MFVYYFATLDLPAEEVEDRLLALFDHLEEHAGAAYRQGEEIAARLRISGPVGAAKEVKLRVWPALRAPGVVTLRIAWEASGATPLFPRLDGDLVIAELAAGLTQLSLRGSYTPPLGAMGRALDKALLHRVAETSVKGFVDRIVTDIEHAVPVDNTG